MRPANHVADFDDVPGLLTWDGVCAPDANGNSSATLSNGWTPFFAGRSSCVIALDASPTCPGVTNDCATRVGYGASWQAAANHAAFSDDLAGVLTWEGTCRAGSPSHAVLSNGWTPFFTGADSCDLSFRHTQCNSLFDNPVVAVSCPDPGVMKEGDEYFMACTSGGPAYPIRSSTDLVHWTSRGTIFTGANHPAWATGDYWAPEIHKVGNTFVAYFSARHTNGHFAVGAAHATNILGPYTDVGQPLVNDPNPGVIDAHEFEAASGAKYLLWKVDGNAVGASTPIKIQRLAADGLSLTGMPTTILSNTLAWEGNVVEGAWMIENGGFFYLFYSGNGYASTSYAIGVARSSSPTGPFTKAPAPILVSNSKWSGPGHGSVVLGPSGDWVHVYHAWVAGKINQAPGRQVLVDRIRWENGWPTMLGGPSSRSQPMP